MMNSSISLVRLRNFSPQLSLRAASTSSKDGKDKGKIVRGQTTSGRTSLGQLQGLLSTMKISKKRMVFFDKINKYGNSDMFNYATNKQYSRTELKTQQLETWNKLSQYDMESSCIRLPLNGFQEMILLTERGRMWKYPIDNEQGMETEKQTPFEDHVFLDNFLDDFPKNDYIQSFMGFIFAGLARNHWMTVDRKHEIIKFYKDYFNDKRELYKTAGLQLDTSRSKN